MPAGRGCLTTRYLDQSFKINDGLRLARHLLLDLAEMEVPAGTEFLDMITPQYLAGLVSWGAIGARTTESQVHRQLVSGLSCPVGFKNGTSGDAQIAIEAILSAAAAAHFSRHHEAGAIRDFRDHRQSRLPPDPARRKKNRELQCRSCCTGVQINWKRCGLAPRVMIDCSHANSSKDYKRQAVVCRDVAGQIAKGDRRIIGMMIESNLVAGAQKQCRGSR